MLKYEGNYVNDVREGKGKLWTKNQTVAYEGDFKDGVPHGKGQVPTGNGTATTEWVYGVSKSVIEGTWDFELFLNIKFKWIQISNFQVLQQYFILMFESINFISKASPRLTSGYIFTSSQNHQRVLTLILILSGTICCSFT